MDLIRFCGVCTFLFSLSVNVLSAGAYPTNATYQVNDISDIRLLRGFFNENYLRVNRTDLNFVNLRALLRLGRLNFTEILEVESVLQAGFNVESCLYLTDCKPVKISNSVELFFLYNKHKKETSIRLFVKDNVLDIFDLDNSLTKKPGDHHL